jgi:hypothetical protein
LPVAVVEVLVPVAVLVRAGIAQGVIPFPVPEGLPLLLVVAGLEEHQIKPDFKGGHHLFSA